MSATLERWRLVLGDAAEPALGEADADVDGALSFLYDRERAAGHAERGRVGDDASRLSVPEWLDDVHRLFPREAALRLERDALERYALEDALTDPTLLERVEPSPALLRAVLRTKHRMDEPALDAARRLVARVAEQMQARLAARVERAHAGGRRRGAVVRPTARDLDLRSTVHRNLKGWDPESRRLTIERPVFFARTRRRPEPWQLVLLVDQSASMLGSAVHAAITASCLHALPALRRHLVVFDTEVVDLSAHVDDPVELLMRVQLGGGTDIHEALTYGAQLLHGPRAIVVLVSDLLEGGDRSALVERVRGLRERGARVLVLASLDEDASPRFDRELGQRLADAGAEVGAMTPGRLVELVCEVIA